MKEIFIVFIVCFTFFAGCSTVPKPSEENNTLIIGKIINDTNEEGHIVIKLLGKQSGKRRTYSLTKGGCFSLIK
jgi:hypothetical protein